MSFAGGWPPFEPLLRNPHLLTILGNYWPRRFDFTAFRSESRYIQTEPDVQVFVHTQHPDRTPAAELVLLHGLEGSGDAGYMVSLAHAALSAGFIVHRFHMRTCGNTEHLCQTLYHAGLTSDLHAFLRQNRATLPLFLTGFSLGGNVALKAAAEDCGELVAGVCTVSAAIDLAACASALHAPRNRLYETRFVDRMKKRLLRTGRYAPADLAGCHTIYTIDDRITAPSFGFGTADRYYETQSALRFVSRISVPTLMITAQDDTMVPYQTYLDPAIRDNPNVEVLAPRHGGHLGFLSRRAPRFWVDQVILAWLDERLHTC